MASTPPATLAEFKVRFSRNFIYGAGPDKVMDSDISNAMSDALPLYNPALFDTATGKLAFLFATAHFVATNVQAAGGLSAQPRGLGIEGVPDEILTGKSVGGVSMNMESPPDIVKNNSVLRQFWSTIYGRRYLTYLEPKIKGAFGYVEGPLAEDTNYYPNIPFADWS